MLARFRFQALLALLFTPKVAARATRSDRPYRLSWVIGRRQSRAANGRGDDAIAKARNQRPALRDGFFDGRKGQRGVMASLAVPRFRNPNGVWVAGIRRDDVAETTGRKIETSSSRLPGAAVIFPISPYISPPGCPKARERPPVEVIVAPAARKSRRRVLTPSFYGS